MIWALWIIAYKIICIIVWTWKIAPNDKCRKCSNLLKSRACDVFQRGFSTSSADLYMNFIYLCYNEWDRDTLVYWLNKEYSTQRITWQSLVLQLHIMYSYFTSWKKSYKKIVLFSPTKFRSSESEPIPSYEKSSEKWISINRGYSCVTGCLSRGTRQISWFGRYQQTRSALHEVHKHMWIIQ